MTALAYSPNGKTLAVGGRSGHIRLWDPAKGKELLAAPDAQPVVAVEFGAGGKQLVLGSTGGVVRYADAATGKVLRRIAAPGEKLPVGVFAPGCQLVAFLTEGDAEVRLWDVVAGKELRRFKTGGETMPIQFGPRGKLLAILDGSSQPGCEGSERTLRLWDTSTGQPLRSLALAATNVVFSPNGKVMALAGEGTICVCEVATGKERCRLHAPAGGLECLAFSRLAAGWRQGAATRRCASGIFCLRRGAS